MWLRSTAEQSLDIVSWNRWILKISYARHRFPPGIVGYAGWLYFRLPLSYRDVEDLLCERVIDCEH